MVDASWSRKEGRSEGNEGFPGKEPAYQCRKHKRCGFNLWVRKILWSMKWQPTPVFLPGKSHGWRILEGYSPWGHKGSGMTEH